MDSHGSSALCPHDVHKTRGRGVGPDAAVKGRLRHGGVAWWLCVRGNAMRTAPLVCVLALLANSGAATAADIVGRATVIDGDTLEIRGERIRLHGIDAPESVQVCEAQGALPVRSAGGARPRRPDRLKDRPLRGARSRPLRPHGRRVLSRQRGPGSLDGPPGLGLGLPQVLARLRARRRRRPGCRRWDVARRIHRAVGVASPATLSL